MKVLQLCKKLPYPLKDGESIAVNSLSRAMVDLGCEMTLLAMNTEKHFSEVPDRCSELDHYTAIHTIYVDNTLNPFDAFIDLVSGKSYNITRFDSPAFHQKLIELITNNSYDVIQLETSYLGIYIDTIIKHCDAKVVLRSHNLEYEIWERISDNTKRGLKSWYLNKCAERLFDFEVSSLDNYDLLVTISDQDVIKYKELGYNKNCISSPAGLNLPDYQVKPLRAKNTLSFIGSLDWIPNLNGLQWFVENVWAKVHQVHSDLHFHVAGRNLNSSFLNASRPGIKVEGEVDCAKHFISAHNIMIVPLFSGSGIRIKILEGMALGRTIISTSIGAEGIGGESGKHYLLADNEEEFQAAISKCMSNPALVQEIAHNAREFVEENYSNLSNATQLIHAYKELTLVPELQV